MKRLKKNGRVSSTEYDMYMPIYEFNLWHSLPQ